MTRKAVMVLKRALHYSFLVAVCSVLSYSMIRNAVGGRAGSAPHDVPPAGKVVVVAKTYRVGYCGPAMINGALVLLELPNTFIIVLRGRVDDGSIVDCEQHVPQDVWLLAEVGQVLDLGGGDPAAEEDEDAGPGEPE